MKNLSTWLITMFGFMYWAFRIMVALMYSTKSEFIVMPMDINIEIILLFVAFVCLLLIVKRKMIGVIVYLITYGGYFGVNLYNNIMSIINGGTTLNDYTSLIFTFIGVILPLAALLDMLLDKNRMAHPKDKKTDWFYKNEDYDRKLDERADKNNYRTL